jgi:cytoskeletal protein RodZ
MRGLPDSGLMVRLTRGRAWIGLLSVLLTGIVALNVVSLSLGASQGKIAQQAQILSQENSALRARLAQRLSNDNVRTAAESLGMTLPGPTDISYRAASGQSVRLTALRLAAGFGLGSSLAAAPVTTTSAAAPTSTTTSTTTSAPPTTTSTPAAATSTPVTAPTAPVATTGTPGGGVSPG